MVKSVSKVTVASTLLICMVVSLKKIFDGRLVLYLDCFTSSPSQSPTTPRPTATPTTEMPTTETPTTMPTTETPTVMPTMCIDVKVTTIPDYFPAQMSWSFLEFSDCFLETNSGIEALTATEQMCCLRLGTFEIECKDEEGYGWASYYENSVLAYAGGVVIQGVEYCKGFHNGYSMTDSVTISDSKPPESMFV